MASLKAQGAILDVTAFRAREALENRETAVSSRSEIAVSLPALPSRAMTTTMGLGHAKGLELFQRLARAKAGYVPRAREAPEVRVPTDKDVRTWKYGPAADRAGAATQPAKPNCSVHAGDRRDSEESSDPAGNTRDICLCR